MREIVIGGRSLRVTHVDTETTEYGAIQRYRIDVSGSDAVTHLSSLRSSPNVDARVMASVIDTELRRIGADIHRTVGAEFKRQSATARKTPFDRY